MIQILKDPRILLLGLASWAIPFAVSFLFFDQTGQIAISKPLFKSIMVVVGGGVGVALLLKAFGRVPASMNSGLIIGCYWLALNLVLDLVVLVPMSGMSMTEYFYDIGLRYLLLPIIATGMGMAAQKST